MIRGEYCFPNIFDQISFLCIAAERGAELKRRRRSTRKNNSGCWRLSRAPPKMRIASLSSAVLVDRYLSVSQTVRQSISLSFCPSVCVIVGVSSVEAPEGTSNEEDRLIVQIDLCTLCLGSKGNLAHGAEYVVAK